MSQHPACHPIISGPDRFHVFEVWCKPCKWSAETTQRTLANIWKDQHARGMWVSADPPLPYCP